MKYALHTLVLSIATALLSSVAASKTDVTGEPTGENPHLMLAIHFEPGRMPNTDSDDDGILDCNLAGGYCYPTNGYDGPADHSKLPAAPSTAWPDAYWTDLLWLLTQANLHNHKLGLHFQAQWAHYVLTDEANICGGSPCDMDEPATFLLAACRADAGKLNLLHCWIDNGHEIGMHHHALHTICNPDPDDESGLFLGPCGDFSNHEGDHNFGYPEPLMTDAGVLMPNRQYQGKFWSGYSNLPTAIALPWLRDWSTGLLWDPAYNPIVDAQEGDGSPSVPDPTWDPQFWNPGSWLTLGDDENYLGSADDHWSLINLLVSGSAQESIKVASIGPGWQRRFSSYGAAFIDFSLHAPPHVITHAPEWEDGFTEYWARQSTGDVHQCTRYTESHYNPAGSLDSLAWNLPHHGFDSYHNSGLLSDIDSAAPGDVLGWAIHVFNMRRPAMRARIQEFFSALASRGLSLQGAQSISTALGHVGAPMTIDGCLTIDPRFTGAFRSGFED